MRYFYKDGFYMDDSYVPEDAIEITEERYHELLDGQGNGYMIVSDEVGYPILIEQQPSQYHVLSGGVWHISDEDAVQLKKDQQDYIWKRIKLRREEADHNGVFIEKINKTIQTDPTSKTKLDKLSTYIDRVGTIQWKCEDNSHIELDKALLDDIQVQIILNENQNHRNAENHRIALLEAEDPLHYDYSTGWTDIPPDTKQEV